MSSPRHYMTVKDVYDHLWMAEHSFKLIVRTPNGEFFRVVKVNEDTDSPEVILELEDYDREPL